MGIITQTARIAHHRITSTGTIFTVPPSEDFTSGNWVSTDLALGELGINLVDDKIFFRTENGIVEIATSSGLGSLWERVGDDIVAVENGLSSPAVYPDILPTANNVCDLGSASLSWKDFHIEGKIIFDDEITIGYRTGSVGTGSILLGGSVGTPNTASSDFSFVVGDNSISSGTYAGCIGQDSTASGAHSFSVGNTCISSGNKSFASGGHATANHYGEQARSSFFFSGQADAQHGSVQYGKTTTNATITELFLDGPGASQRFTVAQSTIYAVEIRALAVTSSTGDSAMWTGKGIIKNLAGTTSLVAAIVPSQDAADASMVATVLTVTADNGNSSLLIQGTGIAATTIKWNVTVNYTKIA